MGLTLLAAAWLAGCGQRGPLYLPPSASAHGSGSASTAAPAEAPSSAATTSVRP
ncbi:LPS translocon maturation chaperone LptM [Corticibacter populi]|nr:lipoprotein [Corticibacter populi]